MKKLFVLLSFLATLPCLMVAQEIPSGKYANGRDYFRFLPGQKVEYKFSDEACVPSDYKGTGSYEFVDGRIGIHPGRPANFPDSTVKRIPLENPAGAVMVSLAGAAGILNGVSVTVVDVDQRTLAAQVTDNDGIAVIKIPEGGKGMIISLIGYETINVPNLTNMFNYEVFMEKPASIETTRNYFNAEFGGLQYKFTDGVFSICRMTYNCVEKSSTPEWFDYQ